MSSVPSAAAAPFAGEGGCDVAIIGGGVIGLAIGWRLAEAGVDVAIFERGRAGQGASRAAAGMLAAAAECEPGEEALLELTLASQQLWPAFHARLEAASGLPVEYRERGILVVALGREEVERLRFKYAFQKDLGLALEWLDGRQARALEPALRAGTAAAIHSPGDHTVEARQVVAALLAAFRTAGGRLYEQSPVERLEVAGGRAAGVRLAGGFCQADTVILAAGAWSAGLPGLPAEARPPVRPLRGQALALRMDPARPLLSHTVWTEQIYLTPRRDGRLVIGATVEEQGFDESVTAGGLYALLEAARRALPGCEELALDEIWCGLRPTARDDAPILGETALPGLLLATGHHRNGFLLAPATAEALARPLLGEAPFAPARTFTLARFAPTASGPRSGSHSKVEA